ncbi:hypothetical protein DFH08DRAFT_938593 [Mycena albidolilacea]|uniref:Uncharacterized protein n=1 Tax=Mycena albidolilacea TaxID=1033008 RepID=A0AAD6ZV10_9AGAR|nr:hypothetical protein DFH08DRAFT_938593 [Mycena albidolilacea]
MSSSSDSTSATAASSSSTDTMCNISSGITFVINTQGPGPFTFNINVNGMPTGDNTANFTVNTDSGTVQTGPATVRLKRALRLKPAPRRKFLATPRKSGAETDVVLETPAGMLACEMPPRKKTRHSRNKPAIPSLQLFTSQDVTPPRSQRSPFLDPSATEGSVTDYHNNEPVAQFSPNCQLVTPSRKRRFERMD